MYNRGLRVRAEISSHSAAGPQARWRGAVRCVPGAVREERATKPAGLRAAARRGAILSVLTNRNRSMIEQPTLAPECEVISARALSRREFFATAGGAFAATMAAIPQVVKALPAAATSLGKVKIRDIKTARIMARYPLNLVKIERISLLLARETRARVSWNISTA